MEMIDTEHLSPHSQSFVIVSVDIPNCHNKRVLLAFCDTGDTVLFRVTC